MTLTSFTYYSQSIAVQAALVLIYRERSYGTAGDVVTVSRAGYSIESRKVGGSIVIINNKIGS